MENVEKVWRNVDTLTGARVYVGMDKLTYLDKLWAVADFMSADFGQLAYYADLLIEQDPDPDNPQIDVTAVLQEMDILIKRNLERLQSLQD